MGSHGPWDSHVAVDFPMNESPFRGSRAAKSRQLLEYFGVHGMTKELQHERQKEVVCAHKFFRRKGTKPILQVTVYKNAILK
jgi:hypothetical protein